MHRRPWGASQGLGILHWKAMTNKHAKPATALMLSARKATKTWNRMAVKRM